MQPTDLPQLIREAASDPDELPRLSRAVVQELPGNRWDVLDQLRTALRVASEETSGFSQGFLEALAQVVRAYQAEALPRQEDQALAILAQRRGWMPVLDAMRTGPIGPTDLRMRLGQSQLSTVSRQLKEMRQLGLVDLFASPGADGRMRPHHLTELGKRVLEALSREHDRQDTPAGDPAELQDELQSGEGGPPPARPAGTFQRLATVIPEVGETSGLQL